jgi:alpha-tubulin suppressor-like RCC1 family protein
MNPFASASFVLLAAALPMRPLVAAPPAGSVVMWGMNLLDQGAEDYYRTGLVVVAGQPITNAVAVAAGGAHALALRTDGTVVGWGANGMGEAVGAANPGTAAGQVKFGNEVLSNVVAFAAGPWYGQSFSLALKADAMIVAWGDNRFGQISLPAGLRNVTAIAAGSYHGLALMSNGRVMHWGQGNPPPNWLSNVVAIAAGGESGQNMALRRDGTVAEWPVLSAEHVSTVPAGLSNVVAIATAGGARLALKADGTVVGWGGNRYGQATGIPTPVFPSDSTGTVMIAGQVLSNVAAIAAGSDYSVALKRDGSVVTWGHPFAMQIDPPAGLSNVTAIAAGYQFCLAITTNTAPFAVKK